MVPAAHVPPLQQPPWQVCVALHVVVHVFVVASHAMFAGQSDPELQPHTPLLWTHALPPALPVQTLALVEQVPPLQHAELQSDVAEHDVEHVCVVVLQA